MRAFTSALWAVFSIWVGCVIASPALACSALDRCLAFGSIEPGDGAQGVLRNIELRLDYRAYSGLERLDTLPIVEDLTGHAVEVDWTRSLAMLRGRLRTPLAAQTTYRVLHYFATCMECGGEALCPSSLASTLATFTTGSVVDDTQPAAAIFEAPQTSPTIRATAPSECGPYDRCRYTRKFAPLAAGELLRLMQGEQTIVEQTSDRELAIDIYVEGSRYAAISGAPQQLGAADYEAYVVDRAGNLSEPVRLTVPVCQPYEPLGTDGGQSIAVDAGPSKSVDGAASASADAASEAENGGTKLAREDNGEGCSVGSTEKADHRGLGWMFAISMALAFRRRRHGFQRISPAGPDELANTAGE